MKRTRFFQKFLAGTLALALGMNIAGFVNSSNMSAEEISDNVPSNPVYNEETDTTDWDYVYFGSYPQTMITGEALTLDIINAGYNEDGDAYVGGEKIRRVKRAGVNYFSKTTAEGFFDWNGIENEYIYFKFEPMKWRVLQNEGDTLLLLSDKILDCQRYERSDGKITWATCSVRNWLNAYIPYTSVGWSFINTGFNEEERQAIVTSNLSNPSNPFHGTNGGAATEDKIFFMSVDEMTNEEYGFPSDYTKYSKSRQLVATDYSKAMGVWMGTKNGLYDENGLWMLRTPGSYQQTVSLVYWFGHVYQDGYYADTPYYGVAPALRVDASSDLWTYAGDEEMHTQSLDTVLSAKGFSLAQTHTALEIALGIKKVQDGEFEAYDLNKDGKVSLSEVRQILCIALGIIDYPDSTDVPPAESGKPSASPGVTNQPDATTPPEEAGPSLVPATKEPVATLLPVTSATPGPLVQKDCEPSGKVWIAGDSIADSHSKNGYIQPLYGWGELIGNYFDDNKLIPLSNNLRSDKMYFQDKEAEGGYTSAIINAALSSRSTKSFTNENNYANMMELMGEGDYLLVSFGHNDERADVLLYTDPFGSSSDSRSFKWFLKNYYIDPAIRAGVQPVLVSPVPRRYFYNGKFINPQLHTPYGKAMKELVEEYDKMGIELYYIDLHSHMLDIYEGLGEQGTIPLHGKYGDTMDNTHLSQQGATIVCEYIVSQMVEQNMDISKFIKEEYKLK